MGYNDGPMRDQYPPAPSYRRNSSYDLNSRPTYGNSTYTERQYSRGPMGPPPIPASSRQYVPPSAKDAYYNELNSVWHRDGPWGTIGVPHWMVRPLMTLAMDHVEEQTRAQAAQAAAANPSHPSAASAAAAVVDVAEFKQLLAAFLNTQQQQSEMLGALQESLALQRVPSYAGVVCTPPKAGSSADPPLVPSSAPPAVRKGDRIAAKAAATAAAAAMAAAAPKKPAVKTVWPAGIMLPPDVVTAVQNVAAAATLPLDDCADDLKVELIKQLTPLFANINSITPALWTAAQLDKAAKPSGKAAAIKKLAAALVENFLA